LDILNLPREFSIMLQTNPNFSRCWLAVVGATVFACLGLGPAGTFTGTFNCFAQENNAPPAGYRTLFNGRDLSGWTALETQDPRVTSALSAEEKQKLLSAGEAAMKKFWRVEDGVIVNDGEGPFLSTLEDFGDFELWIDYKTVAQADSGIYLKATPQVQIWDFTEAGGKWNIGADKGSGGLWNNSPGAAGKDPLVLADKPFGEWNRFRIRQIGSRTSIWLNDKLVVDHAVMENYWGDRKLPLVAKGPIQLQTHGGQICWKNIFVREIPADEANQVLAQAGADGFQSIFNGKDLQGWKGAVDGYEVVDGALRCQAGHFTPPRSMEISRSVLNSSCLPLATMAWRFAIPARAMQLMSPCANCKCSTVNTRITRHLIRGNTTVRPMVWLPQPGDTIGPPVSGIFRKSLLRARPSKSS
jgi:hypothetical protein